MSGRILVVDDEAHIVQVVSLKLRNAGFEVLTAVDGEEGLEIATRELPDLIITDFQMPYMTGLELCHALAKSPETSEIPILMLTARGYALDEEDLAKGNIKDVLSKPFSPRLIVQQVHELLSGEKRDGKQGGEADASPGTTSEAA
ncbi:MAG: response regulator [Phycisphaerales bacterium]|nr:MAG: response regulator [Phycisphaerales bacterium]